MAIIDSTFFIGEINIPNTSNSAVLQQLNFFIAKYEEDFLVNALGRDLYIEFAAGILVDPIAAKWQSLLTGADYVYGSQTRRFNGLIQSSPARSIIANYIYYWFVRNNHTMLSGIGEIEPSAENSTKSNPSLKLQNAWNEMSYGVVSLREYLNVNKDTYPTAYLANWYNLHALRPINLFNL